MITMNQEFNGIHVVRERFPIYTYRFYKDIEKALKVVIFPSFIPFKNARVYINGKYIHQKDMLINENSIEVDYQDIKSLRLSYTMNFEKES